MSATLGQRTWPELDGCANCRAPVHVVNYALGPQVVHYDPSAGLPSSEKGTAWRYCKNVVATMPEPAAQKVPT